MDTIISLRYEISGYNEKTKLPIIFDATHSVQLPGGKGNSSGGQSQFVSVLAKAAVTTAISGILWKLMKILLRHPLMDLIWCH